MEWFFLKDSVRKGILPKVCTEWQRRKVKRNGKFDKNFIFKQKFI